VDIVVKDLKTKINVFLA